MRKIYLTDFKVATSETARDINRRILLNLIRQQEPVSRADRARRSGLQRSTVSAIAEPLISERWVIEGTVGHAPHGRRPTLPHLNKQRAGIIGVDIRALTTTIGIANLNLDSAEPESLATGPLSDRPVLPEFGVCPQFGLRSGGPAGMAFALSHLRAALQASQK